MAACAAAQECIWLRGMLEDMGIHQQDPTALYEDNQACIRMANNHSHHGRTKHIATRHHFIKEQIQQGTICLNYLATANMPADALTKPLHRVLHSRHITHMGVCDTTSDPTTKR